MNASERRAGTGPRPVFGFFLISLFAASSFGQDIYWAEFKPGSCSSILVRRTLIGSTTIDNLVDSTDNANRKVRLDALARQIYWTEGSKVRRANLDSPGIAEIVSVAAPLRLSGFTLDLVNGKIYWIEGANTFPCANPNCPRINRANLDGSNIELVLAFPVGSFNLSDIAVDAAAGKVYYADRSFSPFISRVNFDGTMVEPLLTTSVGGANAIALDVAGGKMYWIEAEGIIPGNSRIRMGNLDASSPQDIVAFIASRPRPKSLALDSACNRLYWTFAGFCPNDTGDIRRTNLTTMAEEVLFAGLAGETNGIAVDAGADSDADGTPDCNDGCPSDANKIAPGECGCGVADTDSNADGVPDCSAQPPPQQPLPAACCAPTTPAALMVAPLLLLGLKRRVRRLMRRQ
jgi:hypothetical protein